MRITNKKKSILRMISSDSKLIITVSIFAVLTVVYLCSDTVGNVFWTIYAFGIKDFLIITLASFSIKGKRISDLFAIGLMCYMAVPTIIRIHCAINSNFNYIAYRELLNNSEYSYLLLLVLFFICALIYYVTRNERKIR